MEMKCDSHGWVQARHFCHKCVADYLTRIAKLEAEGGLMAEHTPTPWEFTPYAHLDNAAGVVECTKDIRKTGRVVAFIRSGPNMPPAEVLPNAAFIVRAANCHEDLVRELEDCELSLKLDVDEWGSPRLKGTLANIRAALAKAEESRLQQQDLDEETL